jgi:hypothetical protein
MPADVAYVRGAGPIFDGQARQIGGPPSVGTFRQIRRSVPSGVSYKTYSPPNEVPPMARTTQSVPGDWFRWVVGGLLGLIVLLVGGGFGWAITDLREVRTEIAFTRKDVSKELADTRVQLVKEVSNAKLELTQAINAVQTQAVVTNTKLDDLISVTRQRH